MKKTFVALFILAISINGCNNNSDNDTGGGANTQPSIQSVNPNQAQVGDKDVRGSITGTNLGGVTAVHMGDGVETVSFTGVSATQIDVTFSVVNNASTGARTVTVTTPSGVAVNGNAFNIIARANALPKPRFTVEPEDGNIFVPTAFDASRSEDSDGRVTEYSWDFGDGKKDKGAKVEHQYKNAGRYDVTLKVKDNAGETAELTKEVKIVSGTRCRGRSGGGPANLFTVVSADRSTRTIIADFEGGGGCNAYYTCGDVRLGGFRGSPGKERWIGIMCEFYDLGGGLAIIRTVHGNYWPSPGDKKLYTWPQLDCTGKECSALP